MMANNETGVLQPVEEIGKVAAEAECTSTPTRCRQGEGGTRRKRIGCDLLSISGHKCMRRKALGRYT